MWMSEARGREAWNHTSLIAMILVNSNIDPKKTKPFEQDYFNPYAKKKADESPPMKVGIELLKAFVPTPQTIKTKAKTPAC